MKLNNKKKELKLIALDERIELNDFQKKEDTQQPTPTQKRKRSCNKKKETNRFKLLDEVLTPHFPCALLRILKEYVGITIYLPKNFVFHACAAWKTRLWILAQNSYFAFRKVHVFSFDGKFIRTEKISKREHLRDGYNIYSYEKYRSCSAVQIKIPYLFLTETILIPNSQKKYIKRRRKEKRIEYLREEFFKNEIQKEINKDPRAKIPPSYLIFRKIQEPLFENNFYYYSDGKFNYEKIEVGFWTNAFMGEKSIAEVWQDLNETNTAFVLKKLIKNHEREKKQDQHSFGKNFSRIQRHPPHLHRWLFD